LDHSGDLVTTINVLGDHNRALAESWSWSTKKATSEYQGFGAQMGIWHQVKALANALVGS